MSFLMGKPEEAMEKCIDFAERGEYLIYSVSSFRSKDNAVAEILIYQTGACKASQHFGNAWT